MRLENTLESRAETGVVPISSGNETDLSEVAPSDVPGDVLGNITIVVDGFSAPLTGGAFIDLCLRWIFLFVRAYS